MNFIRLLPLLLACFIACNSPSKPTDFSLSGLVDKAPSSIFDHTTEGISDDEKKLLFEKGESEYWQVMSDDNDRIIVSCKIPSSLVTFFLLPRPERTPILVSYTENEQSTSFLFWEMTSTGEFQKLDILPEISALDFFLEDNQDNNMDVLDRNVSFTLGSESLDIGAFFNTWMEGEFEKKQVDYEITLVWNNVSFNIEKELIPKEEPKPELVLDERLCDFPEEIVLHPPKQPTDLDTRFFPVGMSPTGVFAYLNYNGEMDPCECVHAELNFYSLEMDSIINTAPFRVEGEDYQNFIEPEKVWDSKGDEFCTLLDAENITITDYDQIVDEELLMTIQLNTTPSEVQESVTDVIDYVIVNDESEVVANSAEYSEIIDAELITLLRYHVGEDYFFIAVVATTHPDFEGSLRRKYSLHSF